MFSFVPHAVVFLVLVAPGRASERADDSTTTVAPEPTLLDSAREVIGNLMDSGSSEMTRRILAADISSQCSLGLFKLMRGIRNLEPWALRLIDSTGKYPTGLLQGSQIDLGAFDECVETLTHDQFGNERIRGQYCSVYITVVNDTSFKEALIPAMSMSHPRAVEFVDFVSDPESTLNGINIGICMINDCSREDLQEIANAVSGKKLKISIDNCVTNKYRPMTRIETSILIGMGVIAILIACSTAFHIFIYATGSGKNMNKDLHKVMTSFSLINGTETFLKISKDTESDSYKYRFLHGIRLASATWVVVGHSAITFGNVSARRIDLVRFHNDIFGCVVTAAFLSVDTFFFLSGFLLAYNLQQQKKSNRFIAAVAAIFLRHIRITVPTLFVIASFYLVPVISSGPGVVEMMSRFYKEMDNHWYELIFQVRNFGKDLDNTGCFQHLWYISTDFQLFLVALLVFTCFRGKPWIIIFVFGVLSLLGCSVSCWQMYNTDYYPFPVVLGKTLESVIGTINDVYVLPSYHAVCYFSGCIVLLLLQQYSGAKMSKLLVAVLWTITAACCLTCVFIKFDWNRGRPYTGSWAKMAFAFWDKIIWSFALSWTVFACSTNRGGLLQRLSGWKRLVPFSRFTLGIYLIHVPLLHFIYNSSRERIYYSRFNLATVFFGVGAWCLILSYFLFIVCEVPTATLSKLLFTSLLGRKNKTNKEDLPVLASKEDLAETDVKCCPLPVFREKNGYAYESAKSPFSRL